MKAFKWVMIKKPGSPFLGYTLLYVRKALISLKL